MAVFQRVARSSGAVLASIVGSFVVYGAHLACGPSLQRETGIARVVPSSAAGTASAPSSESSVASSASSVAPSPSGGCGCASAKATASFVVTGDEKIVLDPLDAQVSLDVAYARGPLGKRQIVLSAVVRAYRSDVAAERPTTFGIRVHLPDSGAASQTASQVEAYVTTWGAGSVVAPRAYASVAKSALTYTVTDSAVEIRGSITLKDAPTGRSITLDKLSLKKVGTSILPERTGSFRVP
ncbi:MAG: hypothetical protein ACXWUG_13150 [Polyangiales bacterium]